MFKMAKLKNSFHGTTMHVRVDRAMTLFTCPGTRRTRRVAKRISRAIRCGSGLCHCGIFVDRS